MGKEKIGDYTVDTSLKSNFLGGGSFGQVYLAHHDISGDKVAAKKILTYHDEERIDMIKSEIRSLQCIQNHPNVLKLLHVQTFSDAIWLGYRIL